MPRAASAPQPAAHGLKIEKFSSQCVWPISQNQQSNNQQKQTIMRKQFNLEYYLEHPETKVVTRNGRSARILCTDLENNHCQILAAYKSSDSEYVSLYHNNGLVVLGVEHNNDLFFDLPDQEKKRIPLTYEDLLERVKEGKTMWIVSDRNTAFNIVHFDFEAAYYIHGNVRKIFPALYEWLSDCMTFADGDPCWKEVTNEGK